MFKIVLLSAIGILSFGIHMARTADLSFTRKVATSVSGLPLPRKLPLGQLLRPETAGNSVLKTHVAPRKNIMFFPGRCNSGSGGCGNHPIEEIGPGGLNSATSIRAVKRRRLPLEVNQKHKTLTL